MVTLVAWSAETPPGAFKMAVEIMRAYPGDEPVVLHGAGRDALRLNLRVKPCESFYDEIRKTGFVAVPGRVPGR